jgi:hypothetical protein
MGLDKRRMARGLLGGLKLAAGFPGPGVAKLQSEASQRRRLVASGRAAKAEILTVAATNERRYTTSIRSRSGS